MALVCVTAIGQVTETDGKHLFRVKYREGQVLNYSLKMTFMDGRNQRKLQGGFVIEVLKVVDGSAMILHTASALKEVLKDGSLKPVPARVGDPPSRGFYHVSERNEYESDGPQLIWSPYTFLPYPALAVKPGDQFLEPGLGYKGNFAGTAIYLGSQVARVGLEFSNHRHLLKMGWPGLTGSGSCLISCESGQIVSLTSDMTASDAKGNVNVRVEITLLSDRQKPK
jgi:hypothetical protein